MHRITERQRELLLHSIDSCTNNGSGVYVINDNIVCVIAHLAKREGVPVEKIKKWDDGAYAILSKKNAPLQDYPIELLHYLQCLWDKPSLTSDHAKDRMRKMVELAASENYNDIKALAFEFNLPILSIGGAE